MDVGRTYLQDKNNCGRSLQKGRISINGAQAKPARTVKPGDVVQVRKPPVTYSFKVLQAIEKRVGAKLVPDVMENVTTPDQYELLEMSKISGFVDRARGTGRPTKRNEEIWTSSSHRNTWMILTSTSTRKKTVKKNNAKNIQKRIGLRKIFQSCKARFSLFPIHSAISGSGTSDTANKVFRSSSSPTTHTTSPFCKVKETSGCRSLLSSADSIPTTKQ